MNALSPILRLSAVDEVVGRLTGAIEKGEIRRGEFLPAERELAARLGVSRVVVREAAKQLEQRGMVKIRQGIGVIVTNEVAYPVQETIRRLLPENSECLRQGAEARRVVEPELAALAASRATPGAVRRLQEIQEALLAEKETPGAAEQDIAFHDAIAGLAGNKVLALMLQSIVGIGRRSREVTIRKVGARKAWEHHEKILHAIAEENPAAARQAMKAHLDSALDDLA